jgi:hypothetical protein
LHLGHQIRKKSDINFKVTIISSIELESRNEFFLKGNRKHFTSQRAAKLLAHLPIAESLRGDSPHDDAIGQENEI